MTTFNGHRNWNHWNVSLWLSNDEVLYRLMTYYLHHTGRGRRYPDKKVAAIKLLEELKELGSTKTPDGAPYTVSSILAAMRNHDSYR